VTPRTQALKNMAVKLEEELKSLYLYFGEDPDSSEAPKSEDFFNLILSFGLSVQVSKRLAYS
jgi:diaphanous 1